MSRWREYETPLHGGSRPLDRLPPHRSSDPGAITHTAMLTPATGSALQDDARNIATVRFLGGPGAITQTVRDDVAAILE